MITLNQTRTGLLAEIEATDRTGEPLRQLTDPRFANEDVRVRFRSHAREELFSLLKLALTERFAAVPRQELIRDLLVPLRNVLGNAFRHGNGSDPVKAVSVELVLTRMGAFIAITDEGAGFDVASTFRRFQAGEIFFANQGDGFRNLHRAASLVSYEHGGRTALLCFRPTPERAEGKRPFFPQSTPGLEIPNAGWLQNQLTAEVPEFSRDRVRIESCQLYAASGHAGDHCGPRYVLRMAGCDGRPAGTRVLTASMHASDMAAEADFEAATRLHAATGLKGLRIPRPLARLAAAPRLVLYEFDPWMNLREYLTLHSSPDELRHCAARMGRALARLHRSQVAFRSAAPEPINGLPPTVFSRVETNLELLAGGCELLDRFRRSVHPGWMRGSWESQRIETPVHGDLSWDCIHFGGDGRFYLYRFATCQRSDPGLDLGGFVADLRCFTLCCHDAETYRMSRDAFLGSYNSRVEHPVDQDQLLLYTVLVLSERLRRFDRQATGDLAHQFHALETVMRDRDWETTAREVTL